MNDRPLCVALVTPAWPSGAVPNGIVTYTAQLVPAFRELGARPVILSWEVVGESPVPADFVDISEFQPGRSFLSRAAAKARRYLRALDFGDAKYTMIEKAVRSALARYPLEIVETEEAFGLASRIIRLNRVPVVTRLQGPWFLNGDVLGAKKDSAFFQRVAQERRSIALADGITAPSQDVLDRTRAYYELPLDHAQVIPCPIDGRDDNPAWTPEGCDPNRILFVGRFDRHKGADLMFDAFSRLASKRPALVLDFIGPDRGVPDPSGGLVSLDQYLARHVTDADVRRRINVLGQKPAPEINDFRRRALVTVVPSRYETFGYTAVEAMSLGCPLVAGDAGGLGEIIRDGQTGLLFPSGDAHSLAAQIDRLLTDPTWAAHLGEAARHDVARRYNPTSIAAATLDFYASVIERRHSRSRAGRQGGWGGWGGRGPGPPRPPRPGPPVSHA